MKENFTWWFSHWCAFNMTALNHKCWKFHHLFHDIEKPFLLCFLSDKKVQKFHRKHNAHHLEYVHGKKDYISMAVDWESARFTKETKPLSAVQFYNKIKDEINEFDRQQLEEVFEKYGFK